MQTATNPETGQRAVLIGGEWKIYEKSATNDKGQKAYFVGDEWVIDHAAKKTTSAHGNKNDESGVLSTIKNIGGGAIRGAGSIGATIIAPYDIGKDLLAGKGLSLESNRERRKLIDEGLKTLGVDTESTAYGVGKFGSELAGTLGTGGLLAKGAAAVGASPAVVQSLKTWGMNSGKSTSGAIKRAADITRRAAAGGVVGGTAGGLLDPENADTGAVIGAGGAMLLPPVIGGASRLAGSLKDKVYPSPGSIGVRAAGDKAEDVINALVNTKSSVPGVKLTSGQASVPANSAEFAALQELVSKHAPSKYFGPLGVEGQQEAARLAAIRGISGASGQMEKAISTRTAESSVNYKNAFEQPIKRDKELSKLWRNPYFKDEVGEAWKIAKANGLSPKKDLTQFLHYVKEGLDARLQSITKPDAPAISKSAKNAIQGAKNDLLSWLEKKNPAYEFARKTHAQASIPIEQMKFGRELEGALLAPATGFERPSVFGNRISSAGTKISKNSGLPRIESLSPQQRKTVDAVMGDFVRNAAYEDLARKGAVSLGERVGKPQLPPTGFFQPIISAGRSWVNKSLGTGYEKGLERAAKIMDDPVLFAHAMKNATPAQRAAINSILEQYLIAPTVVASQPKQQPQYGLLSE